jgi:hypothetical protein
MVFTAATLRLNIVPPEARLKSPYSTIARVPVNVIVP